MVTTALRDLQLPAAQVMAVTGHRSELQMRRDYHLMQLLVMIMMYDCNNLISVVIGWHASWTNFDPATRCRASLAMFRYAGHSILI